jgi:hypothetical protein
VATPCCSSPIGGPPPPLDELVAPLDPPLELPPLDVLPEDPDEEPDEAPDEAPDDEPDDELVPHAERTPATRRILTARIASA